MSLGPSPGQIVRKSCPGRCPPEPRRRLSEGSDDAPMVEVGAARGTISHRGARSRGLQCNRGGGSCRRYASAWGRHSHQGGYGQGLQRSGGSSCRWLEVPRGPDPSGEGPMLAVGNL